MDRYFLNLIFSSSVYFLVPAFILGCRRLFFLEPHDVLFSNVSETDTLLKSLEETPRPTWGIASLRQTSDFYPRTQHREIVARIIQ
jgi:hypothetical protein